MLRQGPALLPVKRYQEPILAYLLVNILSSNGLKFTFGEPSRRLFRCAGGLAADTRRTRAGVCARNTPVEYYFKKKYFK